MRGHGFSMITLLAVIATTGMLIGHIVHHYL